MNTLNLIENLEMKYDEKFRKNAKIGRFFGNYPNFTATRVLKVCSNTHVKTSVFNFIVKSPISGLNLFCQRVHNRTIFQNLDIHVIMARNLVTFSDKCQVSRPLSQGYMR